MCSRHTWPVHDATRQSCVVHSSHGASPHWSRLHSGRGGCGTATPAPPLTVVDALGPSRRHCQRRTSCHTIPTCCRAAYSKAPRPTLTCSSISSATHATHGMCRLMCAPHMTRHMPHISISDVWRSDTWHVWTADYRPLILNISSRLAE